MAEEAIAQEESPQQGYVIDTIDAPTPPGLSPGQAEQSAGGGEGTTPPADEATLAAAMAEVMGQQAQQAPAGDEVVFDFGGDKMSFAKGATAEQIHEQLQQRANNAWRTITQKNQDLSAQQRQLQEATQRAQQYAQVNDDVMAADIQVRMLQASLDGMSPDNMRAVRQQYGDEAYENMRLERDSVQSQLQQAQQTLQTKRAEQGRSQQDQLAQQLAAGQAQLAQIPGLKEAGQEVVAFWGQVFGHSPEQAMQQMALSPAAASVALDAMRFRQLQAKLQGSKVQTSPGNGVAATPPSQKVRGGATSESGVGANQVARSAQNGDIDSFMAARWASQREDGG